MNKRTPVYRSPHDCVGRPLIAPQHPGFPLTPQQTPQPPQSKQK